MYDANLPNFPAHIPFLVYQIYIAHIVCHKQIREKVTFDIIAFTPAGLAATWWVKYSSIAALEGLSFNKRNASRGHNLLH